MWMVLGDEQMSKRWLFSILDEDQMSNWLGWALANYVQFQTKQAKTVVFNNVDVLKKWFEPGMEQLVGISTLKKSQGYCGTRWIEQDDSVDGSKSDDHHLFYLAIQ